MVPSAVLCLLAVSSVFVQAAADKELVHVIVVNIFGPVFFGGCAKMCRASRRTLVGVGGAS